MSAIDPGGEARRWLRFADEDLKTAAAMTQEESFVPRHACWLAQQAAEKAIKGALVKRQTDFPRSHDLELLWNLLPEPRNQEIDIRELARLSEWAVEARYPGDWSEASIEDARQAVKVARLILTSIASIVGQSRPS